jgi:hypothetical protein
MTSQQQAKMQHHSRQTYSNTSAACNAVAMNIGDARVQHALEMHAQLFSEVIRESALIVCEQLALNTSGRQHR